MADVKKIDGYWINDSSARSAAAVCVRYDVSTQGLDAT